MSPSSDSIQHNSLVLDALDSGIVILGGDHRVLTWNVWMERATDVAQATLIGRSIWDAFPALLDTRFGDAINDALDAGASSILTHSLHAKLLPLHLPDGRPLLHDLIIRPLSSQSGRHCLIQVKDVTVTVERERLLRERRDAKYRAVVDTAQDAIVTTDAGGTVQWMNSAAERTFGLASQDALGKDITHLLSPGGDVPWPRDLAALALRESSAQPVELTVERGTIAAVIGRNGVGKSTLMKTLIGLLPAMDGTVSFEGRDMRALKPHQRAHLGIGYVPQGREVFPRMSVEENLKVGEIGRAHV